MTIEELVGNFNTTPFLFVGSGMSRRYLNLPDWKGLLQHFVSQIGKDEFAYNAFENKAKSDKCRAGVMPKIAELIQKEYDASVSQIWNQEKSSLERATRLISHLPEDKINVDELEIVLQEIFENDANVLETAPNGTRSHIRRLIMVYDYLKWGKQKELHD